MKKFQISICTGADLEILLNMPNGTTITGVLDPDQAGQAVVHEKGKPPVKVKDYPARGGDDGGGL